MFRSREEAARKLTLKLLQKLGKKKALIIALPKGAVVMGKIIAESLFLPLDILVVKKIGAPFSRELAIGAVVKDVVYWNKEIINELEIEESVLNSLKKEAENERDNFENILKGKKRGVNPRGETVIIVDDGVATGATVMAALKFYKKRGAKKVILATPVISSESYKALSREFDQIIALKKVTEFQAVGQFYLSFPQVSNQEVINLLK
jgi:putative phosphoribosyl transferase